jgi:ribonuclease BN (tRNA processing enzyme)
LRVQFLGSGDAFGSGGRFNTCLHVTAGPAAFLVDCGASSMVAIRRFGVDPNGIAAIFVSHLHGDHFGGLPFFILDAQLVSRRTSPLTIAGPPGLGKRLHDAMEVLFPGSTAVQRKFAIDLVELAPGAPATAAGIEVTPFQVEHAAGAPPFALRFDCGGKVLAYSGDTEWTPALIAAAREADLFVAEAYFHDKRVKYHLDWASLRGHLHEIRPKRLVLTHMSPDMLGRPVDGDYEKAEDGMVIEV